MYMIECTSARFRALTRFGYRETREDQGEIVMRHLSGRGEPVIYRDGHAFFEPDDTWPYGDGVSPSDRDVLSHLRRSRVPQGLRDARRACDGGGPQSIAAQCRLAAALDAFDGRERRGWPLAVYEADEYIRED